MKFILVLVAFLGVSFAAPTPYSLSDDLNDLGKLIDGDKLTAIVDDNLKDNGDLIEIVTYLKGDDWAGVIAFIGDHPDWIELKDWLTKKGIPVEDIVSSVHDTIQGLEVGEASGDSDLDSFLDEVGAAIPLDKIVTWAVTKLITSADVRALLDEVKSKDTHTLVNDVLTLDEVEDIRARLTEMGVAVDADLAVLYGDLGWGDVPPAKIRKFSPRDLDDDLGDFGKLIPLDDIETIVDDHLATDGAFVAVIDYLQGDEWAALVDTVLDEPAVQDFVKYLDDAGLPVADILAELHDVIANAVPGTDPDEDGSLRPLLDEVEADLPVADLVALLNDKLQSSPDFQALYVEISSEDARKLVESVLALDEAQRLVQRLTDLGVKVDDVLAILYEFLGWGKPPAPPATIQKISPRDLADEWNDFGKLISFDDIDSVFEKHLASDGAFVAVVNYLQGDDWKDLVANALDEPVLQNFVQYLNDAGFEVADVLDGLHDAIANAVPGTEPDTDGSLRPILDDVEAVLPVADLVALLNAKLQSSPTFQALYVKLSSEVDHNLAESVLALDEAQDIGQRLRDFDVEIDEVVAFLFDFLSWGNPPAPPTKIQKFSPRDLEDDLQDFVGLLPLDEINDIVNDHLATDGAFDAVIVYLQGDQWADLVDLVLSKPEVGDFIKYLDDAGLNVSDLLGWLHDIIDNAVPGTDPDEEGSLRPLLDEIEADLPGDDLISLLNDKLQNSPDIQDLYVKISSEDARTLVEEIRQIAEVQRLAQRLRDLGVNVDDTLAIIFEFLGWGKPATVTTSTATPTWTESTSTSAWTDTTTTESTDSSAWTDTTTTDSSTWTDTTTTESTDSSAWTDSTTTTEAVAIGGK